VSVKGVDQSSIGYVTKQVDGRYFGHIRAASISAEIGILPNIHKAADAITESRMMTQGIENDAGWTSNGGTSGKDYVSLAIAASKSGLKRSTPILMRSQVLMRASSVP
jgi:uncharacterized protein (DUF736 family)